MHKYYLICFTALFLKMTIACSTTKNQKNNSKQYPEKAGYDDHIEPLFRSFIEHKMTELITYAKEKNPLFPFATMVVDTKTGKEICRGINSSASNPTLHGEIAAINNCVNSYAQHGVDWTNLTLITTAEPCPMCQGAIIWAGIERVVYGTSIKHLIDKGWRQIEISSEEVCSRSNFNKPKIIGGMLSNKTDPLFIDRNKNK
jgi:tRNA(adenine34) deaminase